jgi:hypothetical protein
MKAVSAKSRVSLAQGDLVAEDPAYLKRFSLYGVAPRFVLAVVAQPSDPPWREAKTCAPKLASMQMLTPSTFQRDHLPVGV